MPRASQKDRSRARTLRIRKRPLDASERAWLDEYQRKHPPPGTYPSAPAAPEPSPAPAPEPEAPQGPAEASHGTLTYSVPLTSPPPPPVPPPTAGGGDVPLPATFFRSDPPPPEPSRAPGPPPAAGQSLAKGPGTSTACRIPDCPRCRQLGELQVCGQTGERVWPPMSEAGARGAAALMLTIVGLLIYVAKKKHAPRPTERERQQLAEGLREVARRRVNALGAVDDLLAVGWVLVAYTTRGLREAGGTE